MRFISKLLFAALLLVPACTLEDGQPWGKAEFEVNAGFSAEGRELAGRIKTSKDYAVQLDALEVNLVSVALNTSTEGGTASFDPANPPEGYGLCHNGHCHSADGRLVDYAAIEAELAGAGASGSSILQSIDRLVDLTEDGAVPLKNCSNDCETGRGFLKTIELRANTIEVRGRVFDTRADSRLPVEGVELRGVVDIDAVFSRAVKGELGRSEPPGLHITVDLVTAAPVFDVFDFALLQVDGVVNLSDHAQVWPEFNESIQNNTTFDVNISRHEI